MTRQPRLRALRLVVVCAAMLLPRAQPLSAEQPVTYKVSFPAPEHHYAQVEVKFSDVTGVVEARMSRSSPGRPGDRIGVTFRRRNGVTGTATITVKENPAIEVVPVESSGCTLSSEQKQFRTSWLGTRH